MKVAICDDESIFLEYISKKIQAICSAMEFAVDVHTYANGNDLLNTPIENFDALFLDLDMPDINGMEIACKLRKTNQNMYIIFVTNRDDLVFECFKFKALRFIRKTHLDEELTEALETLKYEYTRSNTTYRVLTNKRLVAYPIDNILYFESNKHYITMHLVDGSETIRKSMENVEEELSNSGFIRTHVGYIVNCKYIFSIEKSQVILFNPVGSTASIKVPISRNKHKSVQERYMYFSRSD